MFWDQTVIELFKKGGFAMWPLLVCSVIGVTIIIERALYFILLRLDYSKFVSELKRLIVARNVKDSLAFCKKQPHPIAKLAERYLHHLDNDELRNDILRREGSLALEIVEKRLRGLAALTHIAPLLGLLGTVTGLVAAFHQIELLGGQVQPSDLAAGIWEALITTVFGLVIAIPCMAAYHGFESITDKIARRMQFVVSELDELFGKHSSAKFQSSGVQNADEQMKAVG